MSLKNAVRFWGIIVLAAVIGFTFTACGDVEDGLTVGGGLSTLSGNVTITPDGTVTVNTELTAAYSGTETVIYQWYKDNTAISGATSVRYTPATAGSYTVTVSRAGFNSKTSAAVTVNAVINSDITYTVTRADGKDGTADTTAINFTFSASVTGLTANDITIVDGSGSVTKGTLSGSGTSWTLGVTVTAAGNLTITIAKSGIEAEPKDVTVYKAGQTAPTLTSITAVYTQGSTIIYPTTPLDSLKAGLTVTATYSNGATQPVTAYTLSGTLTVGTSTITVTYEGETTTFTVTVTAPDITYTATQTGGTDNAADSTGIEFTFSESVDSLNLTADDITVGGTAGKGTTLTGTGTTRTLAITVTSAGQATVQIAKTGIEAGTKHVTVYKAGQAAPTLTGITAVYNGTATIYSTTPLNNLKENLTVKAQYSNGSEITLSQNEYTLSGTLAVGISTVIVSYAGETTIFTITVSAKNLTGITLNTASVGKYYSQNETLNLTGLVVTANYSDSTSDAVINYTTSPTNGSPLSTTGTITVTVSYTEGAVTRTATFTVTVTIPGTSGLAYTRITTGNNANTYSVSRGPLPLVGMVIISGAYNGLPVTEIGVTETGSSAFYGCTGITEITIPNSVTSIVGRAFQNCTSLTSITIPNSVTSSIGISTFSGCTNLTSITIGDGVTSIGNSAFDGCTSLTSITIPNSVTSIGSSAFWGCTSLASITIGDGVTSISDSAFGYCDNLTSITVDEGNSNYASHDGILYNKAKTSFVLIPPRISGNVIIPEGVTEIGYNAFYQRTDLTSIEIPASVTSIGYNAFTNCSNLISVTFASGSQLESIDIRAFPYCSSLTSIEIPASVTEIGIGAFANCSNLISVTFAEGSQLQSIDSYVFSGCTNLTSINIPASVTSIGQYAFYGCTSLASITFVAGSQLQSIGINVFHNCTNLTSINIPTSVTSIGYGAFGYCTSLTGVTFAGTIPSSGFDTGAFYNLGDLRDKFYATNSANGTPGTYTRPSTTSTTWTRQP